MYKTQVQSLYYAPSDPQVVSGVTPKQGTKSNPWVAPNVNIYIDQGRVEYHVVQILQRKII